MADNVAVHEERKRKTTAKKKTETEKTNKQANNPKPVFLLLKYIYCLYFLTFRLKTYTYACDN